MTKKTLFYLIFIFALGLFLRFYRLDQNVPQLHADETGHYYLRKLILGQDDNPITFLYNKLFYGTFSFSWLFGLTPLGVRSASAFYGSLSAIVAYFFAYSLSRNKAVAIPMSLLVTILPWSFAISRLAHTHVVMITLLAMIHVSLLVRAKSTKDRLISLIPLAFTLLYYPSMVVIAPIATLAVFQDTSKKQKTQLISLVALSFLVLLPFAFWYFNVFGRGSRAIDLAIWRDVNVTADSNLYRGIARNTAPSLLTVYQDPEKFANKIVFNYPMSVASAFFKNYLSFFSPDFLFLKGDSILRHSTGMVGNFYLFLLPFMVYGAFVFFKDASKVNKIIFATWILASPLPAAITKDGANYLLRVITLMPFLTYFCALGIVSSFQFFNNHLPKLIYGIVLGFIAFFSAFYYFYSYFHIYPSLAADSFEYGFNDLADFQTTNPGKMLIIWDDKYPYSLFCFWQNLPYSICEASKTNTRIVDGNSRIDLPLPEVMFSLPQSTADLILIINHYAPKHIALPLKYFDQFKTSFIDKKTVYQTEYFKVYETK